MADNGSAQSASTQAWPLPSFYFKVSISNVGDISCSEVSGLETEYDEITYRAGDSPVFTKLKMPGLRKAGDLTIKKGIFKDDKALWDWVNDRQPAGRVRQSGKDLGSGERMAQEAHRGRLQVGWQYHVHRDLGHCA